MKTIVGLAGVTLMGIGIGTVAFGLKVGICAGITLFGLGLVIDALKGRNTNGRNLSNT